MVTAESTLNATMLIIQMLDPTGLITGYRFGQEWFDESDITRLVSSDAEITTFYTGWNRIRLAVFGTERWVFID